MKRSERGFTSLELVVTVAIIALVAGAANIGIFQVLKGTELSNDYTIAVRQAQSAGYWISNDAQMARTIEIGDDPGTADDVEFIIVHWKHWENGDTHEISYIWLDSADGLKKLSRKHVTRDKDLVEIGNETTFIADNIYTASLSEQTDGWSLTVEARSGNKSETREYEISQRFNDFEE